MQKNGTVLKWRSAIFCPLHPIFVILFQKRDTEQGKNKRNEQGGFVALLVITYISILLIADFSIFTSYYLFPLLERVSQAVLPVLSAYHQF